jgi:hypothetical protein
MDEIKDVEKLEEVSIAATSICEGAKALTAMLVDKYREEHDLLEAIEHALESRGIKYKRLHHLDHQLNIRVALADLLTELDNMRRGILPSNN